MLWWTWYIFVPDEPESPKNLRVKEVWTNFITISWDAPEKDGGSPITGYIIEKRDALRPMWLKAGTVEAGQTTFKVQGFVGTSFCWNILRKIRSPSLH